LSPPEQLGLNKDLCNKEKEKRRKIEEQNPMETENDESTKKFHLDTLILGILFRDDTCLQRRIEREERQRFAWSERQREFNRHRIILDTGLPSGGRLVQPQRRLE
jgi:hypothetical protein